MHNQSIFKKMKIFNKKEKFRYAENLSKYGFYLPSGLGITNKQITYVAKKLIEILK